ncbi:MAG: DUF11 domain-containing protein, partial [Planctomycetes bacterium]|nr:DUF11 domain-containing protein [Planctomycetota bacterium]
MKRRRNSGVTCGMAVPAVIHGRDARATKSGITLVELVIAVSIMSGIAVTAGALLSVCLRSHAYATERSELHQEGALLMQRMTSGLAKTTHLLIPNAHATTRVILAFAEPINEDNDFYFDDPLFPRVNEDMKRQMTNDGKAGIKGIDDDGDGAVDEGNRNDDDEDGLVDEDPLDGIDNDGDSLIDFPADPGCTDPTDDDEKENVDLFIVKQGSRTTRPNGQVVYTLTAGNNGSDLARNVIISDRVPAGLIFNSALSSPRCVLNGSQTSVLCNDFSLAGGSSRSFTVVFNVSGLSHPSISCNRNIFNRATVSTSSTDIDDRNNVSPFVQTTILCAQCEDGVDNDSDGAIDFPDDFSCTSPQDDNESEPRAACADGIDNDRDGLIDFPNDPGCFSFQDDDERNGNGPQCDNGIDDDGDSL